jgi:dTDP-D-glucose 4,6-dehydratase
MSDDHSACWLVRHLTLTYPNAYNIVSFDKLDYCSSLNNTRVLNDKRNFTFYHGDITNPSEVMDCLERHKIDTIFHFAAQSHVDLSFGNSYAFTHTNVYGTHVLLESAKKVGIKKFIHISTDEVYGEVRDDADDLLETSILAPTNPYAASKAAAEMLVHSYQKSFKLPVIIVRSNNVYGPHQYPESKSITRLFEYKLLIAFQKSFPNSAYCSIEDSLSCCTVPELRPGDISLLAMQLMLLTQFFTRVQWTKSTMLVPTTRYPT